MNNNILIKIQEILGDSDLIAIQDSSDMQTALEKIAELVFDSDMVVISKSDYESLIAVSNKLLALERAGVDNWEGYDIAMEYL